MKQLRGFAQKIRRSLLEQAKSGDAHALEDVYKVYSKPVYTLAYRILADHGIAEDVTHDVFMKVFNKLGSLKSYSSVGSWIKKIAANESINRLRAERKLVFVGENDFMLEKESDLFSESWMINQQDLESNILKLDESYRAVLLLYLVEGFKHSEIALMFGKSESFSKVTLLRALKILKKSMLD